MNNCILKLEPELMIPGHFHELGHKIYQRYLYRSAIDLPDYSFTNVEVMTWGELYNFTKQTGQYH